MSDCLFCKIVSGDIPSDIVHDDKHCLAFRDLSPQAPTHILLIPKIHISSLNELQNEHCDLAGHLLLKVPQIATENGLADDGYRLVVNCGNDGGQTVGHLHMHLLGGRMLNWPPG
ncbi:MAG: histidine triad (HIT) family protein [Candidatus Krumholzibacteriia bacterium]|jgi:histidine triad (HIT) family protein